MVVYRSAYQQFFEGPDWDEYSKEEYRSKVKYRSDRRSVEHQHHVWFWDSEVEDDDIEEVVDHDSDGNIGDRTQAITLHGKARDGESMKPREAWADTRERRRDNRTVDSNEEYKNKRQVREEPPHRQAREKLRKCSEKKKHRPSSELPSRSVKEKQRAAPFVAYGWANNGKVDKKRTHNVLASSAEVYPAALRAAKRRELDIKKKVQMHEEAIKKKEIIALPDNPHTEYPRTMWTTEYQRNFCRDNDISRHFPR